MQETWTRKKRYVQITAYVVANFYGKNASRKAMFWVRFLYKLINSFLADLRPHLWSYRSQLDGFYLSDNKKKGAQLKCLSQLGTTQSEEYYWLLTSIINRVLGLYANIWNVVTARSMKYSQQSLTTIGTHRQVTRNGKQDTEPETETVLLHGNLAVIRNEKRHISTVFVSGSVPHFTFLVTGPTLVHDSQWKISNLKGQLHHMNNKPEIWSLSQPRFGVGIMLEALQFDDMKQYSDLDEWKCDFWSAMAATLMTGLGTTLLQIKVWF